METVKGWVFPRGQQGERAEFRQSTDFGDSETMYDTVMVDTFVKIHRMHNTKSEILYKLWTLDDNDVPVQLYQL